MVESAYVKESIRKAANANGIPEGYLTTMAAIESSFNPSAVNKSGATGLFQIMPATAKELKMKLEDRTNAEVSANAAAKLTKQNLTALKAYGVTVDLKTEPFKGYLAHQQGAYGLAQIIRAAENGTEVSPSIRKHMNANNGLGKTPQQFLDYWQERYNRMALKCLHKQFKQQTIQPFLFC
jgi:SLT domain-containing protein